LCAGHDGKENPRFIITSLSRESWAAQKLYEERYCQRGDMENRIKEQFSLFADRVSAETMRTNQLRLYLSVMAYVLVSGLRRLGLKATELAQAQVSTIRTKLLKIGAQVRVTVRKIWISMASSYPWQGLYQQVWAKPALLARDCERSENCIGGRQKCLARIGASPRRFRGSSLGCRSPNDLLPRPPK